MNRRICKKQNCTRELPPLNSFIRKVIHCPVKFWKNWPRIFIMPVHDPDTKVIILRSAGEKTFCAGASFDELVAIKNEEEGLKFFSGFAMLSMPCASARNLSLAGYRENVLVAVLGLAAAVDYAIATEAAEIKLSELAVGIGPFVVGPAVERKIGYRLLSAHWPLMPPCGAMLTGQEEKDCLQKCMRILKIWMKLFNGLPILYAHSIPEAMAEMKKIFWKGTEHWDKLLIERAAISGRLVLSEFTKNAIEKFKTR